MVRKSSEETAQPLQDTAAHETDTLAQFLLQEHIHQHQFVQYWQAKNVVRQVMEWKEELGTKKLRCACQYLESENILLKSLSLAEAFSILVWAHKTKNTWIPKTRTADILCFFKNPTEIPVSVLIQESELHIIICAPGNKEKKV